MTMNKSSRREHKHQYRSSIKLIWVMAVAAFMLTASLTSHAQAACLCDFSAENKNLKPRKFTKLSRHVCTQTNTTGPVYTVKGQNSSADKGPLIVRQAQAAFTTNVRKCSTTLIRNGKGRSLEFQALPNIEAYQECAVDLMVLGDSLDAALPDGDLFDCPTVTPLP